MRRKSARIAEDNMRTVPYLTLLATAYALLVLLSGPVKAQESTTSETTAQAEETTTADATRASEKTTQAEGREDGDESEAGARTQANDQKLTFPPGTRVPMLSRAKQSVGGPLVGVRVDARSTDDNDGFVEIIRIPGPTCRAKQDASFVLEDDNGTQATFIDNRNVQIDEAPVGFKATDDRPSTNNIRPINEIGGDGDPATGGLRIVASTDIMCKQKSGTANTAGAADKEKEDEGGPGAVAAAKDDGSSAAEDLSDLGCEELLQRFRSVPSGQYANSDAFLAPEVETRIAVCLEQEIINNTATNDDLPDTGGLPLVGLALLGLASVAAGASVIRGVGRRE